MGGRAESELVGVSDARFPWGTDRSCQADEWPVYTLALPPALCGWQGARPAREPVTGSLGPLLCLMGGSLSERCFSEHCHWLRVSSPGPLTPSRAGISSSQAPERSLYFSLFRL